MGFFDSLFGGKKKTEDAPAGPTDGAGAPAAEPAGPLTWAQRLARAQADEDFDWDYENEKARALVNEFLHEVAPHFGNAKVKELPDDGNIDLRGTFEGSPIRFAVWMSFGSFWAIEMRSPHALAELYVERDHEKIPKHKDEDDPWDEDEERRVFVAKGVFFEGDDEEIGQKLAAWGKLPDTLKTRITSDMERLDCNIVRAYGADIGVHQRPGLPELEDPLAYMQECARLMVAVRDHAPRAADLGAVSLADQGVIATLGLRVTCAFCSSLYVQNASDNNCPNCGAPPQG